MLRKAEQWPMQPWIEWLPVAAGLLALAVPTFYGLAITVWQEDDHAHGPIILAVLIWLFWKQRAALIAASAKTTPSVGIVILVCGLFVYIVGRSQDIDVFQVGGMIPIVLGTLVAMRGWAALRVLWFPLLFTLFLIPFPNVFVDAVTGPLKQNVSAAAEELLHLLGYPIARTGVMLTVGHYQMLVADACSGINSMFSLSALGILYLHLVRHKNWLHNGLMLASILPIAFVANIVRVMVLVLVTYHFGDAAGQGFLHGAAGMMLVMAALIILLALDSLLTRIFRARHST